MRKALPAAVIAAGAAVLVTGCGPHHGSPSSAASSLTSNPVVQQDVRAEQTRISGCLQHGTFTHAGLKAFYKCAEGGMTTAAFEACATKQLTATSLLSKTGRDAWLARVGEKCVVTK